MNAPTTPAKMAILISGRGSNMLALADSPLAKNIALVLSNQPHAAGLAAAQARGIATECVDHRDYSSRADFEQALLQRLAPIAPDVVVLAGFMRVLTPLFLRSFEGKLINIHPSLLPAFTGLHTHQRAIDAGVRLHGCTVHFVDDVLDGGAIIAQAAVPVLPDDTAERLGARVLAAEHQLLPRTLAQFLRGDFVWQKSQVIWKNTAAFNALQAEFYPALME